MKPILAAAVLLAGCATQSADLRREYDVRWSDRMVPLLVEVVQFPTYAGNADAFTRQNAWLEKTARDLGFPYRNAGTVAEIDLAGPPGAPVLGLAVHGDVVPVDPNSWSFAPFAAQVKEGMVLGRGVADDKGPLVQALLAMKVLKESGKRLTHTIRLLVGTDEETANQDFKVYLSANPAPAYTLVLDSGFPVVIGEMSSSALSVTTSPADRAPGAFRVVSLVSGIAINVVPDLATATIEARTAADAAALERRLKSRGLPPGIRLETRLQGEGLVVRTRGKSAHAGLNPRGGRNALIALAGLLEDELSPGGARDVLAFANLAGRDVEGTGLGLVESHPIFGRAVVVPTMLRTEPDGRLGLRINIRSNPVNSGDVLKERLFARVRDFNATTGASLHADGSFVSKAIAFDPDAKIVKRLLASYERATGRREAPAISAGGTYAKTIPNAIAFGMWFPGQPYPGHDVDEKMSIADLHRGMHVLLEALCDLALNEPLKEPLKP